MKAVIAIDSFKGSLTSVEAGEAAAEGILRVFPDADIVVHPIADGGEGTVSALVTGLGGEFRTARVHDPLGRPIRAEYGILPDGTAIIEMAAASGLTLLKEYELDPMHTSTYGTGELIMDAIDQGCRRFIIGIGGSATNDGGVGCLQALGFGFLDEWGRQVEPGAEGVSQIVEITAEDVDPVLWDCRFSAACDVTNPLCGEEGCSAVFAPQKGADETMIAAMDASLARFAELTRLQIEPSADMDHPGAGAAGGLGFALMYYLGAELRPGVELFLHSPELEEQISTADIVVTGEGMIDGQTAMGKAPAGVAELAKMYDKRVIGFCGVVGEGAELCNGIGIDAYFPILRTICTSEEAMDTENAAAALTDTAEQVFRLLI